MLICCFFSGGKVRDPKELVGASKMNQVPLVPHFRYKSLFLPYDKRKVKKLSNEVQKKYLVDEVGAVVDLASNGEVEAVLGAVVGQVGGGEGLGGHG